MFTEESITMEFDRTEEEVTKEKKEQLLTALVSEKDQLERQIQGLSTLEHPDTGTVDRLNARATAVKEQLALIGDDRQPRSNRK
jgi:uncharacterized protein YjgD (DUF1641 family)